MKKTTQSVASKIKLQVRKDSLKRLSVSQLVHIAGGGTASVNGVTC